MKGFLACCLALVPQLTEAACCPTSFTFGFSYDEEVGCIGVRSAINDLQNWPVKPIGPASLASPAFKHVNGSQSENVSFPG